MTTIAKTTPAPQPARPAANALVKADAAPASLAGDRLVTSPPRPVAPRPSQLSKTETASRAAAGVVAAFGTLLGTTCGAFYLLKGLCAIVPPLRPIADAVFFGTMAVSLIPSIWAGIKANKWVAEAFHPELKGRSTKQFLADAVKGKP